MVKNTLDTNESCLEGHLSVKLSKCFVDGNRTKSYCHKSRVILIIKSFMNHAKYYQSNIILSYVRILSFA